MSLFFPCLYCHTKFVRRQTLLPGIRALEMVPLDGKLLPPVWNDHHALVSHRKLEVCVPIIPQFCGPLRPYEVPGGVNGHHDEGGCICSSSWRNRGGGGEPGAGEPGNPFISARGGGFEAGPRAEPGGGGMFFVVPPNGCPSGGDAILSNHGSPRGQRMERSQSWDGDVAPGFLGESPLPLLPGWGVGGGVGSTPTQG